MAKALVGVIVGGYNSGRTPGWLGGQLDVEKAALQKREAELLAEIAVLRSVAEPGALSETAPSTPNDIRLEASADIGAQLVPAAVELDRELVGVEA